jgi:hypothetical protein
MDLLRQERQREPLSRMLRESHSGASAGLDRSQFAGAARGLPQLRGAASRTRFSPWEYAGDRARLGASHCPREYNNPPSGGLAAFLRAPRYRWRTHRLNGFIPEAPASLAPRAAQHAATWQQPNDVKLRRKSRTEPKKKAQPEGAALRFHQRRRIWRSVPSFGKASARIHYARAPTCGSSFSCCSAL